MLASVFQIEHWEPRWKTASFLPGPFAVWSPSQEKLRVLILFNLLLHVRSKWPSQLTFDQRSCDSERLRGKSCEDTQPIDKQKGKNSSILLTDAADVLIWHINGLV